MFQKYIRGFFFDPELEKKAQKIADETIKTINLAQNTLKGAKNVEQIVTLAGLGLVVAGFIAGSMSTKVIEKEGEEKK